MIVGHAFLAFIISALAGFYWGKEPKQCILIGFFGLLFALLPDVDILFAWKEVLVILKSGVFGFVEAFWDASRNFHRGISHSLVTLLLAQVSFLAYRKFEQRSLLAFTPISLTVFGYLLSGIPAAAVLGVFSLLGAFVTHHSREFLSLPEFALASGAGLLTHPFGDIFTGTPPDFFFPLDFPVIGSRVVLNADPVLNLFSVFFIELSTVFAAFAVFTFLRRESLVSMLHPASLLGLGYAPLYFLIPDPTLSNSYRFVFSSVGLGLLSVLVIQAWERETLEMEKTVRLGFNLAVAVLLAALVHTSLYILTG